MTFPAFTPRTLRCRPVRGSENPQKTKAQLKAEPVAGSAGSAQFQQTIWLCPIEDRRKLDSSREGMVEGLPLGSYLLLVDYTGRLFHEGKSAISAELAGILARLGTSAEGWQAGLEKLRGGRLVGRLLAGSCKRYFRGSERRLLRSPRAWACTTWPISVDAPRDSSGELVPHHGPCPHELDAAPRSVIDGRRRAHAWPLRSAPPRSDGVCPRCAPRLPIPAKCALPARRRSLARRLPPSTLRVLALGGGAHQF